MIKLVGGNYLLRSHDGIIFVMFSLNKRSYKGLLGRISVA